MCFFLNIIFVNTAGNHHEKGKGVPVPTLTGTGVDDVDTVGKWLYGLFRW